MQHMRSVEDRRRVLPGSPRRTHAGRAPPRLHRVRAACGTGAAAREVGTVVGFADAALSTRCEWTICEESSMTKPPNPGSDEAVAQGCARPSRGRYVKGCRCAGCRSACRAYAARVRAESSPERRKEINSRCRNKRKAALRELKVSSACADCGYRFHHSALQFDHLRDKRFNISGNINLAWSRILEEVEKCEVVCANCHMMRTWARWNNCYLADADGRVILSVLDDKVVSSRKFPLRDIVFRWAAKEGEAK
jgi:5-methylcytosine-specific restriction endonuclease McrA